MELAKRLLSKGSVKRIVIASLLALGCTAETEAVEYAEGLGTPESPIPSTESYALVSRVTLTLAAPEVQAAIGAVRAVAENPGRALLAQRGGAQVLAAIPAAVRGNVESYLNTELDKIRIAQKTLRAYAGDVVRFAQEVVGEVVIDSSLSITPAGAVHALVDLGFSPADVPVVVTIGGLAADALVQRPRAAVAAAGALAIGEQKFGLGFGKHAWQAINLASESLYGKDLSIFTSTINCSAIAQAVAARCVSGTCVGHAPEIAGLCTSGFGAIAAELGTQFTGLNLTALRFVRGTARLVDEDGDGIADRIRDGSWDAQIDGGNITATFATE